MARDRYLRQLGQRLRELRVAADLTQEQLAEAAGITAKYLSEVESGQVNASIKVLHALSEQGLQIPLAAFFNFSVGIDEAKAAVEEVARLLSAQPEAERQRVLRVLRALVDAPQNR